MDDILGRAIYNYQYNLTGSKLWIANTYGSKEEMPVATYFRDENDMPDIEWMALQECRGKILDIGAGAGSMPYCCKIKDWTLPVLIFRRYVCG